MLYRKEERRALMPSVFGNCTGLALLARIRPPAICRRRGPAVRGGDGIGVAGSLAGQAGDQCSQLWGVPTTGSPCECRPRGSAVCRIGDRLGIQPGYSFEQRGDVPGYGRDLAAPEHGYRYKVTLCENTAGTLSPAGCTPAPANDPEGSGFTSATLTVELHVQTVYF